MDCTNSSCYSLFQHSLLSIYEHWSYMGICNINVSSLYASIYSAIGMLIGNSYSHSLMFLSSSRRSERYFLVRIIFQLVCASQTIYSSWQNSVRNYFIFDCFQEQEVKNGQLVDLHYTPRHIVTTLFASNYFMDNFMGLGFNTLLRICIFYHWFS
jgi:hypothetical protein